MPRGQFYSSLMLIIKTANTESLLKDECYQSQTTKNENNTSESEQITVFSTRVELLLSVRCMSISRTMNKKGFRRCGPSVISDKITYLALKVCSLK